ncbi:hypothetical protein C8J57DRAFT_1723223 [Mycena rebaudengoi]|nr:hypothetical protein C8J57DRAFT_1723223 [Mycena rebaudengoi]
MPILESSSEITIFGGTFIDVARDLNIDGGTHMVGQDGQAFPVLTFGASREAEHQLLSPDRSGQEAGTARMSPYEIPQQPQHLGHPHPSTDHAGESERSLAIHRPPAGPKASFHAAASGGTFIGGNVNHIHHQGSMGIHLLHGACADDAFHNSADRYPQPRCHPETRTEMLNDLWEWSTEKSSTNSVLWLFGPAGAGKSAIAQSFCQELEERGHVVASFFFKRGHASRGNGNRLFPTIAYQLAILYPELKEQISQNVVKDPSIVNKSLATQVQKLIVEPCRQIRSPADSTFVIVIDGLDECEGQNIQQEILRSIGDAVHVTDHPLRVLVASRPEPHIRNVFHGPSLDGFHRPFNIYRSFEDVRTYLVDEFLRIHREHHETMVMVLEPWPSQDVIAALVKKSSGYFIYASTIIKFLDDQNFRPSDRLQIIMGLAEPDFESPFADLDQLYTYILSNVPAPRRPQLLEILSIITSSLSFLSVSRIEELLGLKPGDVRLTLRGLHSVIQVPRNDRSLAMHHASFREFLDDLTRSGPFHVGGSQHTTLASHVLQAFSYDFHDTFLNTNDPFAITYGLEGLKYVTSLQSTLELSSLLRSFNPDFLSDNNGCQVAKSLVGWLKKLPRCPQDLITLWEDYSFMFFCDSIWTAFSRGPAAVEELPDGSPGCSSTLSEVPMQLIRILYAYRLVPYRGHGLFNIRLLLDLSWDKLRKAICLLRSTIGTSKGGLRRLLSSPSHPPNFQNLVSRTIMLDLAYGYLRVLKSLLAHKLPDDFRQRLLPYAWGHLVRSCPVSHDLLQHLQELDLAAAMDIGFCGPHDLHNIIQWLKAFHQPPRALITGLDQHLKKCNSWGVTYAQFEEIWTEWLEDKHKYIPQH